MTTAPLGSFPPPMRGIVPRRTRAVLLSGSAVSFVGAVVVFITGVILTSGTYGSRMAWLLGVVFPLLLLTTLSAWLACRPAGTNAKKVATSSRPRRMSAIVLLVIGFLLVVLAFLAAFTIYGEVAGVVGLACIVSGAVFHGRSSAPSR